MRRRFFSNRFDYMILYTSTDENIVTPKSFAGFNQNIKSNTYNHIGKITFWGPFSIGREVFYDCDNLKTIIIPNGVTSIGYSAFAYCDNLTSATIPNSVTSIGGEAFNDCTGLIGIKIPNSVTSIEGGTFRACSSLTSIEIPNSVTSIGDYAFRNCLRLSSVYIKATTPPTLGDTVFNNNASNRKIYVPRASLDAYKTAEGWSEYADAIEPYDY